MNFFNMGFNNQTIGIQKGTKPIHMVNSQKQKLDFVIITQKEPTNKQGIFGGITLSFHGHIMNMYIYIMVLNTLSKHMKLTDFWELTFGHFCLHVYQMCYVE